MEGGRQEGGRLRWRDVYPCIHWEMVYSVFTHSRLACLHGVEMVCIHASAPSLAFAARMPPRLYMSYLWPACFHAALHVSTYASTQPWPSSTLADCRRRCSKQTAVMHYTCTYTTHGGDAANKRLSCRLSGCRTHTVHMYRADTCVVYSTHVHTVHMYRADSLHGCQLVKQQTAHAARIACTHIQYTCTHTHIQYTAHAARIACTHIQFTFTHTQYIAHAARLVCSASTAHIPACVRVGGRVPK
jgi:hypothetical protein